MVLFQRKLYFSKDPGWVQHLPGGPTFSRGVQMLISIETHMPCDFPGRGGPDPLSPLWICTSWVVILTDHRTTNSTQRSRRITLTAT